MKRLAQLLCVAVVLAGLPKSAQATGEKATSAEDAKYAELEATSPEVASFEGGDAGGTLLFIVLVAAIALIVYLLLEHNHHSMVSPLDRAATSPPAPPQFR